MLSQGWAKEVAEAGSWAGSSHSLAGPCGGHGVHERTLSVVVTAAWQSRAGWSWGSRSVNVAARWQHECQPAEAPPLGPWSHSDAKITLCISWIQQEKIYLKACVVANNSQRKLQSWVRARQVLRGQLFWKQASCSSTKVCQNQIPNCLPRNRVNEPQWSSVFMWLEFFL